MSSSKLRGFWLFLLFLCLLAASVSAQSESCNSLPNTLLLFDVATTNLGIMSDGPSGSVNYLCQAQGRLRGTYTAVTFSYGYSAFDQIPPGTPRDGHVVIDARCNSNRWMSVNITVVANRPSVNITKTNCHTCGIEYDSVTHCAGKERKEDRQTV